MKNRLKLNRPRAKLPYNKEAARKLMDLRYYKAQAIDSRQYQLIQEAKARLSTKRWDYISNLIDFYKDKGFNENSQVGKVLQGIYNKNKDAVLKGKQVMNTQLLSVLATPEMLLLGYKAIKGNKGALTPAAEISKEKFNSLTQPQKIVYFKSLRFPNGINMYSVLLMSDLLKKGLYVWGSSSRVYMDKPGQPGKLRPITIPPFMDRIVQKCIELILISIYEPQFELTNRSFGFRSNKSTNDAITALTSRYTTGMTMAIEGDVEAAYDTVSKEKLISLLGNKIADKQFLSLLKERLDYDFVEKESKKRINPSLGIPQGGIDSPYLFNIYMAELDNFVHTSLQGYVNELNSKNTGRSVNRNFTSIKAEKKKYLRWLVKAKAELTKLPKDPKDPEYQKATDSRLKLYSLIKKIRLNEHKKNWTSSSHPHKKDIRIFFVRYADDWILLTNGDRNIATILREKIAEFLLNELGLKLSEKKTLITNITTGAARFLGYEIRGTARGALYRAPSTGTLYKKTILQKRAGLPVWVTPDRHRLIERYHMKGFCDKDGFPKAIPWLSVMEPQVIIQRFNDQLRGIGEYYLPNIRDKSAISRWIYILRFSCLKTLAQKYRCSIKKIFKRFGYNMFDKPRQTVKFTIYQTVREKTFSKDWILLTYSDIVKSPKWDLRNKSMLYTFLDKENGLIGDYPEKVGSLPKVTNENFLENIGWVSWRTMASIDMPCAYCGTNEKVEQHHLKHVRKRAFSLIPEPESFTKILALRNRKQIPLCFTCHRSLVHKGAYNGIALVKLAPVIKLVDNRIIHVESFVKPGVEYNAKSLIEKGWKPVKPVTTS